VAAKSSVGGAVGVVGVSVSVGVKVTTRLVDWATGIEVESPKKPRPYE